MQAMGRVKRGESSLDGELSVMRERGSQDHDETLTLSSDRLITLNKMNVSDEIDDDQARQVSSNGNRCAHRELV